MLFHRQRFWLTNFVVLGYLATINPAIGQVVPDGTLSTQVEAAGEEFRITGGSQAGGNLFHSFSEFSLPTGTTAYFFNPNVENIITRVTGGSVSNIDGIIKIEGTANLFLLNPQGIIFGPNAELNIGGSFLASTANSIKFADGVEFSATDTSTSPLLTVNVPVGLQFGRNPGEIINRSQVEVLQPELGINIQAIGLRVLPGNTLALVGGDIRIENGQLTADQGRVELGSVAENSFVSLTPISQGWDVGYEEVSQFQDIHLSQSAVISALDIDITDPSSVLSEPGGTIQIQGRRVTLTDSAFIAVVTFGEIGSGDLTIIASESVEMTGNPASEQSVAIGLTTQPSTNGNSGNVQIITKRLILRDAGIDVSTLGQGQGGTLSIEATEFVEISGTESTLSTSAGFPANIELENVPIEEIMTVVNTEGNGGQILITTPRLIIRDGGAIVATSTSKGQGGTITINASESIEVQGVRTTNGEIFPSQISTSAGFENLPIVTQGNSGNIILNTRQLIIENGAEISVNSLSAGETGNINLTANTILLNNSGKLIAESISGQGGNIFLKASDFLELRQNSLISATAGGSGDGGNISINTEFIFASENSDITANAFTGNGGSVNITATGIFGIEFREMLTRLSDITVSSTFGQSGVFTLNRPDVDAQSGLVNLPTEVVDTENLAVQNCGAPGAIAVGEFTITGRGGLPLDYNQTVEFHQGLPDFGSPSAFTDNSGISQVTSEVTDTSGEPIVEAQGWIVNEKGQVVLTAQVSEVTPHQSGLASTRCQVGANG